MSKKVSVVIPFFNELGNIEKIYGELCTVWTARMSEHELEIIFMDNHSSDGSSALVEKLIQNDRRIRLIRLSRNFGFQANILTGYLKSTGDMVVQLDADGEDDPALIPTFVERWKQGFKVVYGIRRVRKESWWLRFQRRIFYRLLNSLSAIEIPLDAGDFRLLDREVVNQLAGFKENNPYLRGLVSFIGYEQVGIPYDRRPRYSGETKFNWWSYFSLAVDGITSFSRRPLMLATWLGMLFSLFSFVGFFFYFLYYFIVGIQIQGFTTLVLVMLLLSGIQLFCMGVLGAYIGRIFDDVKKRPISIVELEKNGN